jgi:hypothetical protein
MDGFSRTLSLVLLLAPHQNMIDLDFSVLDLLSGRDAAGGPSAAVQVKFTKQRTAAAAACLTCLALRCPD